VSSVRFLPDVHIRRIQPFPGRPAAYVLLLAIALAGCRSGTESTSPAPQAQRAPVKSKELPLKQVRIDDPFWNPWIQSNQDRTVAHVLKQLQENGNIRNFEIAAGKAQGQHRGPYWADSDVYKWMQGVSYILANHPDPALEATLDEIIATIGAAQRPDGYINTYVQTVDPPSQWTNLGFQHEMFCLGSLIEAGVAHFEATGKRMLLDLAIRAADHVDNTFGPGKREGAPGHEQIEFALIALYRTTGEKRYLNLAEFLLNERGKEPSVFQKEYERLSPTKTMDFLGRTIPVRGLHDRFYRRDPQKFDTSYCQDHLPVREQSEAVGHAVRAVYLYAAMADVAYETGDEGLLGASNRLHDSVALRRMYVTGGIGPAEHNEGFEKDYDLPNESAYQETCATVGLALWNHRMLKLTGDGRYADLMELSFYNSFLGGVSQEGTSFCYVNPMRSNGDFRRSPWFSVPCCPTTIVRTFPRLGSYIYGQSDDGLWVNLFISGEATAKLANGQEVKLRQTTAYPWEGASKFEVETAAPQEFTLHLRVPGWAASHSVRVNGEQVEAPVASGYADIRRQWSNADTVELSFPMNIERLQAHPKVLPDHGKIALRRGPLVYCLEEQDNKTDVDQIVLPLDAQLTSRLEKGLFGGVQLITGQGFRRDVPEWGQQLYRPVASAGREATPVTAVPYAYWGNRGLGKMRVWVDVAP
jgi:DUF1680 family protein